MKKIITIIGARPQFIKASAVSKVISESQKIKEYIVHTGQHFDENMSDVFFDQLKIPRPNYLLDIHGGSHGDMTGRMMIALEKILKENKPDCVLVYGDTNSTLAGALVAAKLHIPVAHIEAGLRSFNMKMPEEINRILTDRISSILFCPTSTAMNNLKEEGYPFISNNGYEQRLFQSGDVMQDSAIFFSQKAIAPSNVSIGDNFILATVHRAENTDDLMRLSSILAALNDISRKIPVILPMHPRTWHIIKMHKFNVSNIRIIEPVGYLEMLWLLKHCELVVTDSGGVQKEAFFMGKMCITMRDETEWKELVDLGVNKLVGADTEKILFTIKNSLNLGIIENHSLYGAGKASHNIVSALDSYL